MLGALGHLLGQSGVHYRGYAAAFCEMLTAHVREVRPTAEPKRCAMTTRAHGRIAQPDWEDRPLPGRMRMAIDRRRKKVISCPI
jgi:hypothetical protein